MGGVASAGVAVDTRAVLGMRSFRTMAQSNCSCKWPKCLSEVEHDSMAEMPVTFAYPGVWRVKVEDEDAVIGLRSDAWRLDKLPAFVNVAVRARMRRDLWR
jgi:hypothetical protein